MLELCYAWRRLVHTPNISQVAPGLWTFNGMCRLTRVVLIFLQLSIEIYHFSIFATFPRACQMSNVKESLHSCTTLANCQDFAII